MMARGSAPLVAILLWGCDGTDVSRQLAVTVTDSDMIECLGTTSSEALEQQTMDSIAKDMERAWEAERAKQPPTPEGRMLRVNETERDMRAWFDPHTGTGFALDAGSFDDPLVVYVGEPHDGYIEGTYESIFNTDPDDEEAGRDLCGDLLLLSGTLVADR